MWTFGTVIARLWEVMLLVIGITFVFAEESMLEQLALMTLWDLVALVYLAVGALVAKVSVLTGRVGPRPSKNAIGARFSFVLGVVASLTGLSAAVTALFNDYDADSRILIDITAIAAIVLSWLLLHASYAGFYRGLHARLLNTGLQFPGADDPHATDMLYFAFTIGTNLSVSDVQVTTRRMRWHVMVHSIASFFYNATVLATAIKLVTG